MTKSVSAGRFMQRTRLSFDKANFARSILDRAFDRSCWGWARNRRKMTRCRLSGRDRESRLFLSKQLEEQLSLGLIFGQSELPSEDFQFFAAHEFFHGVLFLRFTRPG